MSLIIKGSIMPLMCGDCPCYDGSDYACNATGRGVIEYRYNGRPDNCPIVEIPTPHGRLIDADKFLKDNTDFADRDFIHPSSEVTLRELIDEAPTIIEAEAE